MNNDQKSYFLKHEYKQSSHNYEIDRSASYQVIDAYVSQHTEYMIETRTTKLKTSRYDCAEDNTILKQDCIDHFISEEIQCFYF